MIVTFFPEISLVIQRNFFLDRVPRARCAPRALSLIHIFEQAEHRIQRTQGAFPGKRAPAVKNVHDVRSGEQKQPTGRLRPATDCGQTGRLRPGRPAAAYA